MSDLPYDPCPAYEPDELEQRDDALDAALQREAAHDIAVAIGRLEAATEGSRELDALIYVAIYESAYNETAKDHLDYARRACPHYTTSLDSALTLVPEHGEREVALCIRHNESVSYDNSGTVPNAPLVEADVYRFGGKGSGHHRRVPCLVKNRHHALALALCIAALKARAALAKVQS